MSLARSVRDAVSTNERMLRRSTARAAGRPSRQAMRSRSRRRTTSSGTGVLASLAIKRRTSAALSPSVSEPANLRLRELITKTVNRVQAGPQAVLFL